MVMGAYGITVFTHFLQDEMESHKLIYRSAFGTSSTIARLIQNPNLIRSATKNMIPNNIVNGFNAVMDGKQVPIFELKNKLSIQAHITNFGRRLVVFLF
jgi:hypothetical protein